MPIEDEFGSYTGLVTRILIDIKKSRALVKRIETPDDNIVAQDPENSSPIRMVQLSVTGKCFKP
jgi:hypothetical protein